MTYRGIALAVVALLVGAPSAHAASTVLVFSTANRITLDAVATDNIVISVPSTDRFQITDTAGVVEDPNSEALVCTQINGQTLNCPVRLTKPRMDVVGGGAKPGRDTINAAGAPARLTILAALPNEVDVTGSSLNDVVIGTSGSDIIRGGPGDDTLTPGEGADVISGGTGNDTVRYDINHSAGVDVTVGSGASDDGNAQDGPAGARDDIQDAETVLGTTGDDRLIGDASSNRLFGGDGADVLGGGPGGNDTLDGGAGRNTATYAGRSDPVTVNLTDPGPDGAAGEQDVLSGIQDLVGGAGNDTLAGNDLPNDIRGGGGNDLVIGGNGADNLFGETGDDDMRSVGDNTIDNVDCGLGTDKAALDDIDIAVGCDDPVVTVVDADADGSPLAGGDCNDNDASIRPGAAEVPGDGIDQNCDGIDPPRPPVALPAIIDRDADGFAAAQDCNDADRAIHPGAVETPGNAVDENCDGVLGQFVKVAGVGVPSWLFGKSFTRLKSLKVTDLEAGDVVKLGCSGKGCRKSLRAAIAIKKKTPSLKLDSRVKNVKLKKGARLEVSVFHDGQIARVYGWTVKRYNALPVRTSLCQAPGAAKPGSC